MKHFSTAIVAVFLLLPVFHQAQPLHIKKIAGEFLPDFLLPLPDYCVLNFGNFPSNLGVPSKLVVTKLDSTGNVMWGRNYSFNSSFGLDAKFADAVNLPDSSIVVTGIVKIISGAFVGFCMKLKPNGDTLWCRKIECLNAISMIPRSINLTSDSGFVLCGLTNTLTAAGNSNSGFLAKLTKNGNLGWIKTLNNANTDAYMIKQTLDSGFVLTGKSSGGKGGACANLVRLDKSGNFLWQQRYSDTASFSNSSTTGYDLLVENDGYFCLLYSSGGEPILLRTDLSGIPLWVKKYKYLYTYPSYSTYPYSILYGRPLTLKKFSATRLQITYKGVENDLNEWTLAIDNAGTPQWVVYMSWFGFDVIALKNKNLVMTGTQALVIDGSTIGPRVGIFITDSLGSSSGSCYNKSTKTEAVQVIDTNAVALTLIPGGMISSIQPTLSIATLSVVNGCITFGTGIKENEYAASVFVYPNPSTGKLTIESETLAGKTITFKLLDVTGRMVLNKELEFENKVLEIDLTKFSPAVFLYTLSAGGDIIKNGKIIITK